MLALAAGDLESTRVDRDAFARFLASMHGGPSVLTKKAAAARLGVTRQTVHALVKAGVLDGASGAGGRDLGVTLASVEAYESGGRVRVAI
jgi:hypothetical protein